jgi:hypothetical protein
VTCESETEKKPSLVWISKLNLKIYLGSIADGRRHPADGQVERPVLTYFL